MLNPNSSPSYASADLFGIVQKLDLLNQVNGLANLEAEKIAQDVFEYLLGLSDIEVIQGRIPSNNDPRVRQYIEPLNRLFRLVNNDETGAVKQLNRALVENFDIQTAARVKVLNSAKSGGDLLDILCDIVNQEIHARKPSTSLHSSDVVAHNFVPQQL